MSEYKKGKYSFSLAPALVLVGKEIVEERKKGEFISIEDLQVRAKISATLIDKMRMMGILDNMPESSQLSLF